MDRIFVVSTRSNEPSLIVIEDVSELKSHIYCIGLRIIYDDDIGQFYISPQVNEIGLCEIYDILQTNNRITCYNLERRTDRCMSLKRLAGSILYNHKLTFNELWHNFICLFRYQNDVTEFFTHTKDWLWLLNLANLEEALDDCN